MSLNTLMKLMLPKPENTMKTLLCYFVRPSQQDMEDNREPLQAEPTLHSMKKKGLPVLPL